MKFAILGGTHGNEPVGITVIENLKILTQKKYYHSFEAFHANPAAFQKKVRYVDSDLNRAFGHEPPIDGNEKVESQKLKQMIIGKFDFLIDLHTTTSNMGLTIILTHLDSNSLTAACHLKENFPELKIIVSMRAGQDCPYTTQMAPSALTVEVGPVANNVIKADLVLKSLGIVECLLDFPFNKKFNYSDFECFKTKGVLHYPPPKEEKPLRWMVHPDVEEKDFVEIKNGSPLFINSRHEIIKHTGESIYPLFINEAAYQENNIAMEYAGKTTLDRISISS